MRTTVVVDDEILRRARIAAAERGTTLSAIVQEGLTRLLETPNAVPTADDNLPRHGAGGLRPGVDLADNRATRDLIDSSS